MIIYRLGKRVEEKKNRENEEKVDVEKKIDEEDEEEKSFPDIGTRCGRGLAPHKSAERAGQRERERAREL